MTNRDIVKIYIGLSKAKETALKEKCGVKFKYSLLKAHGILETLITPLRETEQSVMNIISEFQKKKMELAQKYGKPTETPGEFFVPEEPKENYDTFMEGVNLLSNEYKDELATFESKQAEYEELLDVVLDKNPEFWFNLVDLPDWLDIKLLEDLDTNDYIRN